MSHSRQAHLGLSLVELLTVCGLFSLLSILMVNILFQNQRASEKALHLSDLSGRTVVLYEKLKLEFRGIRLIGNSDPSQLEYWIYEQNNGSPNFGSVHPLSFEPGGGNPPDLATLSLVDDKLIRTFQGEEKMLALLGQNSSLTFQWNPVGQTVLVQGEVFAEARDKNVAEKSKKFNFFFSINNVE